MDCMNCVKNKNFEPITPRGSWLKVKVIKNKIIVGKLHGFIAQICFYQQDFWLFLLQSIEDRLRAINNASSETQRYIKQIYYG